MAVYTTVSDAALAAFLAEYEIGEAVSLKGIAEGVENSNYFLETTAGRFVLTLFEKRTEAADLPYFIDLKLHLAARGFACPQPVAARDGAALRTLAGRPAVIVTFLPGLSPKQPSVQQCRELGAGLARLHRAARDFPRTRANALGPASWPGLWAGRERVGEQLQPGLAGLIDADLAAIAQARPQSLTLPRGTIHGDLFPDNAFFLNGQFSGAIDFYFACTDALAYDLAICLNAWAFEGDGAYSLAKGGALIGGYESVRALEPAEHAALPVLARGAGLRFFLTRLVDWTQAPGEALVRPKNPLDYATRLVFHRRADSAGDYGA